MTETATTAEFPPTTASELDAVIAAAEAAAGPLAALRPAERAVLLRGVADALDAAAEELVPLAIEESHLPEGRLRGELTRTTFQLRLFADELDLGAYLEAIIDRADPDWGMGPRPDLRRMLVPVGPVLVFAASNFPFAFSVAGGDTASALAAGAPVVLKAHPGHPRLSQRTGELVRDALAAAGAPDGAFAVVHGMDAGTDGLRDPRIKAGSFTGSIPGGRALFDIANSRPEPIPFYAEMGSLNPVFVTPAALAARGEEIAKGYVGSVTLGVGQFCTKPGLLFLPAGHGLDDVLAAAARDVAAAPMLNERIAGGYGENLARLTDVSGLTALADAGGPKGLEAGATLVKTDVATLRSHADAILEECFGPTSVVVEYSSPEELYAAAELFSGNLTAGVHGEDGDTELVAPLLERLRDRAGRLLWNGWPTGVSVTHAMQHGGPYPATTSLHTSVGTTAIRRFLRPVSYQDVPQPLLPDALRDRNVLDIPRRVDGTTTRDDL